MLCAWRPPHLLDIIQSNALRSWKLRDCKGEHQPEPPAGSAISGFSLLPHTEGGTEGVCGYPARPALL